MVPMPVGYPPCARTGLARSESAEAAKPCEIARREIFLIVLSPLPRSYRLRMILQVMWSFGANSASSALFWRKMRRIPAQLDVGPIVGVSLGEAQPGGHLQAGLGGHPAFDARPAGARGPFLHQGPGARPAAA